jgi:hypothetical protein
LSLANAELGEAAECGLENFNQARVHILNIAIIMQFLNRKMQLAEKLALLNGDTRLLQAADSVRNDKVGVDVALEEVSKEPECVLIHRINNRRHFTFLEIDVVNSFFMHDAQDVSEFLFIEFRRSVNGQEFIFENILNHLGSSQYIGDHKNFLWLIFGKIEDRISHDSLMAKGDTDGCGAVGEA